MIPQITESLANSWKLGLAGISAENIQMGLEAARDHKGYFDLGTFRGYCRKPIGAAPSYSETVARLSEISSFGQGERWEELSKVTAAMMAEPADGPITRAAKAGYLTKNNTRGKSAGEIIDNCNRR